MPDTEAVDPGVEYQPEHAQTPYAVLGLTPAADGVAIKRAYFSLVRRHPPERDPEGFRKVRTAYDALRTPSARAATDRALVQTVPPFTLPRRLPPLDLVYHPEDRWREARAGSDLERFDFSADFRPISSPGEDAI